MTPLYADRLTVSIPIEWEVQQFEEYVFFQEGPGIRNWQYVEEGVPFVNIRCLIDGRLDRSAMSHVSIDEAFGRYKHFLLDADDFIVSSSGTLGRIAVVQQSDLPCMLNTSVIRMRPKDERLDRLFLKYFLLSDFYQTQIKSFATGSAQLNYGPFHLRQMFIVLPPLPEQRAIAAVLGSLDDKIELNRRMNATLEGLARALFQAWFVEFEPVRARIAGRPTGLPGEIEALFPDEMEVGAEGVERPRGWGRDSFASTVSILGGGTPKTSVSEYWGGRIPWYSVVDAPAESDIYVIDTAKHITELGIQNSSTQILPVGTVIISARGTVGKVALVGVPMAMNQSCYGLSGHGSKMGVYTYFATKSLTDTLKQNTHGSVFDTITRDTLEKVNIIVPPPRLIAMYEETVSPLMSRVLANLFQIKTLAALRDGLLPGLMRGEVRVAVE